MCPPWDVREVVLVSVHAHAGKFTIEVLETGHLTGDTLVLVGAVPVTGDHVAMLGEWCALRTPMLLYVDPSEIASLHGPVASVINLRALGTRTQQAA
jgi:hypothetical protein